MFETPGNFKKKLDKYLIKQMEDMNDLNEAGDSRQRPSSANPQRIPSATSFNSKLHQKRFTQKINFIFNIF